MNRIFVTQKEDDVYYIQDKTHTDLIIIDTKHKTISIKPKTKYKVFSEKKTLGDIHDKLMKDVM